MLKHEVGKMAEVWKIQQPNDSFSPYKTTFFNRKEP
jgi:hypothetical protein